MTDANDTDFHLTIKTSTIPDGARGLRVAQLTLVDKHGKRGHVHLYLKRTPKGTFEAQLTHPRRNTDVLKTITVTTWIDDRKD
jgi:hypothetical protein